MLARKVLVNKQQESPQGLQRPIPLPAPAPVLVAVLVQMVRMQAVLTLAEIRPMTPTGLLLQRLLITQKTGHSVNAYHSLSNHPADNDQERRDHLGKRNPVAGPS
jgi:hypothetical protein